MISEQSATKQNQQGKKQVKISIVGAGPSGILLALYLLQRQNYQVNIYEKRGDPRKLPYKSRRNYPLILCQRGLSAFRKIDGLEEVVKSSGIEIEGAISFDNGPSKYKSKKKKLVTINRNSLVIALLTYVQDKYNEEQIKFNFDHEYIRSDFQQQKLTFQKGNPESSRDKPEFSSANYDVLIGADGVHSSVRNNCLSTGSFEFEQKCTHLAYKTLFISSLSDNTANVLQLGRIHGWRSPQGITLLASRQKDRSVSCNLFVPSQNEQVANLNDAQDVFQFFQQNFPDLSSSISEVDAQDFCDKPLSKIWTVRCDRYHYKDSVLMIGDAAHAISPSIGQGCNSALEDVVVLDSLLNEYSDDWAMALRKYSQCRVADAHAVKELADNTLPLKKGMFMVFILRLTFRRTMHRLFPQFFSLPFFDLIPDTNIAYSEIYNSAKNWITKVKKSNQRFLKGVETSEIN